VMPILFEFVVAERLRIARSRTSSLSKPKKTRRKWYTVQVHR
jgi:hypothetical protein